MFVAAQSYTSTVGGWLCHMEEGECINGEAAKLDVHAVAEVDSPADQDNVGEKAIKSTSGYINNSTSQQCDKPSGKAVKRPGWGFLKHPTSEGDRCLLAECITNASVGPISDNAHVFMLRRAYLILSCSPRNSALPNLFYLVLLMVI